MSGELKEKASVYFLFSRLFREPPDSCFLKEIVAVSPYPNPLPQWGRGEGEGEIAIEHTALFIVSGESYIPPYESYYCDTLAIDASTACSPYFQAEPFPSGMIPSPEYPPKADHWPYGPNSGDGMKGFIGGSSASAVRKFCGENGFVLSPDFHDLPDHIACELELMGRFYQEGKIDQARDFFENHLGRWVFTFLEKLEKQKRSLFYQKVVVSLNRFLKQDANALLLKST